MESLTANTNCKLGNIKKHHDTKCNEIAEFPLCLQRSTNYSQCFTDKAGITYNTELYCAQWLEISTGFSILHGVRSLMNCDLPFHDSKNKW
jgi:hypothetical protein